VFEGFHHLDLTYLDEHGEWLEFSAGQIQTMRVIKHKTKRTNLQTGFPQTRKVTPRATA